MLNRNSFRLLCDEIASVHFIWKIYLYFSIEMGKWPVQGTGTVPILSTHLLSLFSMQNWWKCLV